MAKKKTSSKKPAKKPKGKTKAEQKSQAGQPLPKVERFQSIMRCELTGEEVHEAALGAAEKLALRDNKFEQLKATNEHAKAEIKDLESELRRLSGMVRERATRRPVIVERTFDYVKKSVIDRRTDTGELIHEREMTESETQVELPFKDIDDEFSETLDPGEDVGDAKGKKKPKDPKPKDEPKEPETEPDPSEIDDTVEDEDDSDDEEPEAAE